MSFVRRQQGPMLKAKNLRLVNPALETMEVLLDVNRQSVRNAIQATGFPVTVYIPLTNGRKCSCSNLPQALLDANGDLSQGDIDSLVSGGDTGITEYGDPLDYKDLAHTNADSEVEIIESYQPNTQVQKFVVAGAEGLNGVDRDTIGLGDPGRANNVNAEFNDPDLLDEEEDRLFSQRSNPCGVCFGSGFAGGFSPLYGERIVADVTLGYRMDSGTIDNVSAPVAFSLVGPGAFVLFDVLVAACQQFALRPLVYNNRLLLDSECYTLDGSTDGGNTWTELDGTTAMTLVTGMDSQIRITSLVDSLVFTHVELLFSSRSAVDPFKADFPEISKSVSQTKADNLSETTIVFPGDILLNRRAVIIDHLNKLSRHWMVGDIKPRRDQFGNLYDTTVSAVILDLNELPQLLRPLTLNYEPLV